MQSLLRSPEAAALIGQFGKAVVADWMRRAIRESRSEAASTPGSTSREDLTRSILDRVASHARLSQATAFGPVVNATGIVLHTGLGRAPLSDSAIAAVAAVAAGCNLEVDLPSGERSERGAGLAALFRALTGCEDALVVNNNAAATLLTLHTLGFGREVILSRGQLVEIGGSFRLPEIFAVSGARLREIGATNRTRLSDYENAIGMDTAAILRVHPSNYRIVGFTEQPDIAELVALGKARGIPVIDDIGSGALWDTSTIGLPSEPTFQKSLAAGADLVLGSGDKLLGGPQAGIILGRRDLVARLRRHPMARAVRIDKLTIAALTATLNDALRPDPAASNPTWTLLSVSPSALRARALALAEAMKEMNDWSIEVMDDASPVGAGSVPDACLTTSVLVLRSENISAQEACRRLRAGDPRVFPRIIDDAVGIDLRSVFAGQDAEILRALRNLVGAAGQGQADFC